MTKRKRLQWKNTKQKEIFLSFLRPSSHGVCDKRGRFHGSRWETGNGNRNSKAALFIASFIVVVSSVRFVILQEFFCKRRKEKLLTCPCAAPFASWNILTKCLRFTCRSNGSSGSYWYHTVGFPMLFTENKLVTVYTNARRRKMDYTHSLTPKTCRVIPLNPLAQGHYKQTLTSSGINRSKPIASQDCLIFIHALPSREAWPQCT